MAVGWRIRKYSSLIGFLSFLDNMNTSNNDMRLIWTLVKRWWDTTNTFYFLFEEMTLTPIDFTMIMGFHYTSATMEFSPKLAKDGLGVMSLLGFPLVLEKRGEVPISYLMKHSFGSLRSDYVLIFELKAWVTLLVILTNTILENGRKSIKLDILVSLRHTDRVRDYTLASLGLLMLITILVMFLRCHFFR